MPDIADAFAMMHRSAVFDASGCYRYSLTRQWAQGGNQITFVLLNPSTADAHQDDPTIRRCLRFAQAWGFSALEVVNLFAYRATRPSLLRGARDPVGPENDAYLAAATSRAALVLLAWGTHGGLANRHQAVLALLRAQRPALHCLGLTRDGHPRHVLYLVRGSQPVPFVGGATHSRVEARPGR